MTSRDVIDAVRPPDAGVAESDFEAYWAFSIALYANPRFSASCIHLQDVFEIDVIFLLFVLWRASEREIVTAATLTTLRQDLDPWLTEVVRPLRQLRRGLKDRLNPSGDPLVVAFRERIKREELEAERLEMRMLVRSRSGLANAFAETSLEAVVQGIAEYQSALRAHFPEQIVRDIVETAMAEKA